MTSKRKVLAYMIFIVFICVIVVGVSVSRPNSHSKSNKIVPVSIPEHIYCPI